MVVAYYMHSVHFFISIHQVQVICIYWNFYFNNLSNFNISFLFYFFHGYVTEILMLLSHSSGFLVIFFSFTVCFCWVNDRNCYVVNSGITIWMNHSCILPAQCFIIFFFITQSNSKSNPVYTSTYVQLDSHESCFQALVFFFTFFTFRCICDTF